MSHDVLDLQNTLYTSRNRVRRWLHVSRYDWIRQALAEARPAGRKRALEVGPGSGVYLPLLAAGYDEAWAVDIEERFLEAARGLAERHPNLTARRVDILQPEALPKAGFDLILCTEVIEHLPRGGERQALAALRRALAPGGVLILTTPQRWSTLEVTAKIVLNPVMIGLARLIYKEPVNELGHINLMTAAHLRRELDRAGFSARRHALLGLYLPVLSELADGPALALAKRLAPMVRGSPLKGLLWTQCYVAVARDGAKDGP